MSEFAKQLRSELGQLPNTLTKLMGAVVAAVGIARFAYGVNHSSANALDLLLAGIGFGIFMLASRSGERRTRKASESHPAAEEKLPMGGLSWTLLLSLVAILAAASAFMAR